MSAWKPSAALRGVASIAILSLFSLGLGACGSGGSGGWFAVSDGGSPPSDGRAAVGSGSTACDTEGNGTHTCFETSWANEPLGFGSDVDSTCRQKNAGAVVLSCPQGGAVGACRLKEPAGAGAVTVTRWFYTGTAADLMTACAQASGTWVGAP